MVHPSILCSPAREAFDASSGIPESTGSSPTHGRAGPWSADDAVRALSPDGRLAPPETRTGNLAVRADDVGSSLLDSAWHEAQIVEHWWTAARSPAALTAAVVGTSTAIAFALANQFVGVLPLAMMVYLIVVAWHARTRAMRTDPLAAADPRIDWNRVLATLESDEARILLARFARTERRVTHLARAATTDETQTALVTALVQVRGAARSGVGLALAVERVGRVIHAAEMEHAVGSAAVLAARASVQPDAEAAAALGSAARRREQHATVGTRLLVLRERLRADAEDLLAQLERAALGAEWTGAWTATCRDARADAAVASAVLTELALLDPDAIGATPDSVTPGVREVTI